MSDYDSDALAGLDPWLGDILAGLSPAKRKRAATKLGQALRRSNLARITANVEPDGGKMEERKARLDRRGRVRKKAGGKMFRKLRYARQWAIRARSDSVEITLKKGDGVALVVVRSEVVGEARQPQLAAVIDRGAQRVEASVVFGNQSVAALVV